MLVDVDGRISYTSPALQTVLGYEGDDVGRLAARGPSTSAPTASCRPVCGRTSRSCRTEGSLTIEVSVLHADGEWRTMELSAVNLMSNVAVAGIVLTLA